MNIGLLCIATNKYKQFVQPLIDGVKKYFLVNHNIKLFLFTDEFGSYQGDDRVKIEQHPIPSYGFPDATMLRYAIFHSHRNNLSTVDYLYYSDIDMAVVSEVTDEILSDLVAVRHPGFFKGGGSWEDRKESMCYVHLDNRQFYYAGGFNGGAVSDFMAIVHAMQIMIQTDLDNGITPVWHDESALNKVFSVQKPTKILDPDHCMVEEMHLRKLWGIDHFEPKIIALKKNHSEIRS